MISLITKLFIILKVMTSNDHYYIFDTSAHNQSHHTFLLSVDILKIEQENEIFQFSFY